MAKNRKRAKKSHGRSIAQNLALARDKMAAGELASAREILLAVTRQDAQCAEGWHLLGANSYLMGDTRTSVDAFQKAVAIAPSNPDYLNDLASLFYAEGRYKEAMPIYQRVLELAPDFVEAAYNLATCYLQCEQYERAIPALLKICERRPDLLEAAFNLGLAYRRLSKEREALPWLRRAVPLAVQNPSIHAELARCYLALQDYTHACEQFATLPAHDIDALVAEEIAQAHYLDGDINTALEVLAANIARHPGDCDNLRLLQADLLINLGDSEGGKASLAPLLNDVANTLFPAAANLAARIGATADDELRDAMERCLRDSSQTTDEEAKLRFGLGQIEDRAGRYAVAAKHYDKANELRASQALYDRDAAEHIVSELEEVAYRWEGGFESADIDGANQPVFVLGMPRSGTSLIAQILSAHKDVRNAGELGYFSTLTNRIEVYLKSTTSYPACIPSLTTAQLEAIKEPYGALLKKHGDDSLYVIDKFPENFLHIGLIKRVYPHAVIFHATRDARDTALSVYFQNFAKGNAYSWRLTDIAHYFVQYERAMRIWASNAVPGLFEIRYSEVVGDVEAMARRMLSKLSLDWDPSCLEFYRVESDVKTASHWQVRQPIYQSSHNRWKNYPELSEIFCCELQMQRARYGLPDVYSK